MSGPPSYARVLEYHHYCATHGLTMIQTIIAVDGHIWPGCVQPIPPAKRDCTRASTAIGAHSDTKCMAHVELALHSDVDYVTYLALRGQEYDGA